MRDRTPRFVQQELAQIIVVVAEVLHLLEHGGNRHVTDSTGDDDVVDFAPTWHLTTLTIRLKRTEPPGTCRGVGERHQAGCSHGPATSPPSIEVMRS
jgi:hypothetical protein